MKNILSIPIMSRKPVGDIYLFCVSHIINKVDNTEI